MSAYLVNEETIDALVNFGNRPKYGTPAYYYWGKQKYDFDPQEDGQSSGVRITAP